MVVFPRPASTRTGDNHVNCGVNSMLLHTFTGADHVIPCNPATATILPFNAVRLHTETAEFLEDNQRIVDVCVNACRPSEMIHSIRADEMLLWHGTSQEKLAAIIKNGSFLPSKTGFFGPGVYLTSSRQKAEAWARYRAWHKEPQFRGALVQVRVDLGRCKTFEMSAITSKDYRLVHYDEHIDACFHIVGDKYGRLEDEERDVWYQMDNGTHCWQVEGYDSQYIPETSVGDMGIFFARRFGVERWIGDEYVVADGSRVHYVSHEMLPLA